MDPGELLMELRPYQEEARRAVEGDLREDLERLVPLDLVVPSELAGGGIVLAHRMASCSLI